jgi:S1-C subfamily serine protease
MSGCFATMFTTTKQKVEITSKPSGADVYVNNNKVGTTPTKIRVKRKDNTEVTVKKDGYKDNIRMLYPDKINPVAYTDFILLQFGAIGYVVDLMDGAGFMLNTKKLENNLIKIPDVKFNSPVLCKDVVVKFKAGDKLGNIYYKRKPQSVIYFEETIDTKSTSLADNTNTSLKEIGFTVPKKESEGIFASKEAKYIINCNVKDVKLNVYQSRFSTKDNSVVSCMVQTEWQFLDRSKNVIYKAVTKGESDKMYSAGVKATFEDAFENSLYAFVSDSKFTSALSNLPTDAKPAAKEEATAEKKANPAETITISKDAYSNTGKVINYITNGVVTIKTDEGHGSGCIVSKDGYIVTCLHVVEGTDKVKVKLKSGDEYEGTVLRYDENTDLALVKINAKDALTSLNISAEKEAGLGDEVFAIGTPLGEELNQTVSKGVISGERKIEDVQLIQTDVKVNPGNSGGALVDTKGVLLGIVNAKASGSGVEGIGFAIPAYKIFEKLNIKYK